MTKLACYRQRKSTLPCASSEPDDLPETGARRSTRITTRVNSQRGASSRPTAGKAQGSGKIDSDGGNALCEPTTPARRALAARAAGSESIGPTAAQLLAAEEARRAAVESEAQLAGLLASEADRGDELSAEVARAGNRPNSVKIKSRYFAGFCGLKHVSCMSNLLGIFVLGHYGHGALYTQNDENGVIFICTI